MMTSAIFHCLGKCLSRMTAFIMFVMAAKRFFPSFFRAVLVMPSGPAAFLVGSFLIISWISFGVVGIWSSVWAASSRSFMLSSICSI